MPTSTASACARNAPKTRWSSRFPSPLDTPASTEPPSADAIMLRRMNARSIGRDGESAAWSVTYSAGVGPSAVRKRTGQSYSRSPNFLRAPNSHGPQTLMDPKLSWTVVDVRAETGEAGGAREAEVRQAEQIFEAAEQ